MSAQLSSKELIEVVIETEKMGVGFYRNLARAARKPTARHAFERIAQEEEGHVQELERLLERVDVRGSKDWTYPQEYYGYLRALIEGRIFAAEERWQHLAEDISDEAQAARLASLFEKEIIVFLHEIRRYEPVAEQGTVDQLLKDEYEHVRHLHALGHGQQPQEEMASANTTEKVA